MTRRKTYSQIELQRGVSRHPRKPLNMGLKRLREHDRQLAKQRAERLDTIGIEAVERKVAA